MNIYKQLLKKLCNYSTIDHNVEYGRKRPNEVNIKGKVIDEVKQISTTDKEYMHFLQKIKDKQGLIWYRICYYTITKDRTKIIFGQYAPTLEPKALTLFLNKAIKKWFLIGKKGEIRLKRK